MDGCLQNFPVSFLDYSASRLLLIIFLTLALFIRNKICKLSPRMGRAQTLQSDKSHRLLLNLVPSPVDTDLSTVLFTLSWSFAHRHVRQRTGNACCLCNILLRTNWVIRKTKFGSIESGGKFPEKKESCVAFPTNGRSITPRQVPINPTEINKNGSIV